MARRPAPCSLGVHPSGETFGGRFPAAVDSPEYVLSREFVQKHPEVWESEAGRVGLLQAGSSTPKRPGVSLAAKLEAGCFAHRVPQAVRLAASAGMAQEGLHAGTLCARSAKTHTVPLAFQHARFSWSDFACGSLLVCLCSPGKRFSNEFTRFFAGPTCHPWKNVDGLHTHPSLELPRELVVECHGSIRGAVVLYGDPMPHRFYASWLGPTATNRKANG